MFLLAIASVASACKCGSETPPAAARVPAVVSGFTTGEVSRASSIAVRFTSAVGPATKLYVPLPTSPFDISPSVEGAAVWRGTDVLEFRPAAHLEPGRSYTVELPLDRVGLAGGEGEQTLRFSFRVMRQALEVSIDGLESADANKPQEQQLTGTVTTADVADGSDVERVLQARFQSNAAPISWVHSEDGRSHRFIVSGLVRGKDSSPVEVKWNGKAIGAEAAGDKAIDVPAESTFAVISARP